jgi:transcriptional regulator GlxA family with amidase domain
MTARVGIHVYPEVEVLDFAGPFEVFSTATRVNLRLWPSAEPPFAVTLVAAAPGPLRARGGLVVTPDASIDRHGAIEVLLVPGGVHEPELERPWVIAWIAAQARAARLTASVCTGAFLLARAGVLAGL